MIFAGPQNVVVAAHVVHLDNDDMFGNLAALTLFIGISGPILDL